MFASLMAFLRRHIVMFGIMKFFLCWVGDWIWFGGIFSAHSDS